MKKTNILIVCTMAVLLITALPGWSQTRWTGARTAYDLDLTEEQLAKIQDLRMAFQKEILPLNLELNKMDMELDSLMYQNKDQTQIDAKLKAVTQLEDELEKRFLAHQDQIRGLLTDKQKVLFDEFGGLGMGPAMGIELGFGRGNFAYNRFGRSGRMGYGSGYRMGQGRGGYVRGAGLVRGRSLDRRGYGARGIGRGYYCPNYRRGRYNSRRYWR